MQTEYFSAQVCGGVAVLALVLCVSLLSFRRTSRKDSPNVVTVKLMEHESYIMPVMPSITTLTKYRIRGSIEEQLRTKLTEILEKNPWLTGRLTKASWSREVILEYQHSSNLNARDKLGDHFQVITEYDLPSELPYDAYVQAFHRYGVQRGNQCINNPDGKLFSVTLVYLRNTNDVILIFSLSHMIADGYTFYALQNMLDRNTPVTALEVVRSTKYASELVSLFGAEKATWHSSWYIPVGLLACAFFRPKMRGFIVKVRNEWLQTQKSAFLQRNAHSDTASRLDFISTNDILTAWHNNTSRTNVHIMAMNLRNRSAHFTNRMAGNYENSMMYNAPEDGSSPEAVRRSLHTFRNASGSVPGALKTLCWNGSLTTNWCSFYKQVEFNSGVTDTIQVAATTPCEYNVHLPVMTSREMAVWREFMCIFSMDAEHTGLLLFTRTLTAENIEASGVGVVCSVL